MASDQDLPLTMLAAQLEELSWVAAYIMYAHPDVYAEAIAARQQEAQDFTDTVGN